MTQRDLFKFRLYVAGDAPNSVLAIANLSAFCTVHLPERNEVEIVDVFREPQRASAEGIFMTPTLVVLAPLPVRQIVGTLSDAHTVLLALGLMDVTA